MSTSWGSVAAWYDQYLGREDTYQAQVILPNLLRVLAPKKGEKILDLACGQGFFAREIAKSGATVVGADIAPELIKEAQKHASGVIYHVAPASQLSFAKEGEFDAVVCILALQNIEDISAVCREVKRVLTQGGRFLLVLNHPAFRVPKRSSWGWDEEKKIQYRRVEGYLSAAKVQIDMHPGAKKQMKTISYHRSLQDFFKALSSAGFKISHLEEWISHKVSEKGPHQVAEDTARKEIPLFLTLEARA
jgi:ubiquinone/menaquinone biosynthesis C-methylase UbiE